MKNLFNRIISLSWLIFFFLGVLNINSVKQRTDVWNLELEGASYLYMACLLILNLSLLIFEKASNKKIIFKDDLNTLTKSPFPYIILFYPIIFIVSIFNSLGFFPILLSDSFVDEMYEFDYGFIYGYKFICVYSFCVASLFYKQNIWKITAVVYVIFLLFVVSVDGKRFVLLVCFLSMIPLYLFTTKQNNPKPNTKKSEIKTSPLIIVFVLVGVIYVLLSILRSGGEIKESMNTIIENIPFGMEYKDYVHSFNTYAPLSIKNYNFELSALGSFFNSTFLEVFNLNKADLYHMGSQNAWMKLYDGKFGIRLGIIAELYFAYGLFVVPFMIVIAYFINRVNVRLLNPRSYFNLMQNSILFALFILLINGQATVFFGCLTMMVYLYLLFIICTFLPFSKLIPK